MTAVCAAYSRTREKRDRQRRPDSPQNGLLLGDALMADGRYEDAKQQYVNVLDAKPGPGDAHFSWGGGSGQAAKGIERAECKLHGAC
jgi:hypothetical protein